MTLVIEQVANGWMLYSPVNHCDPVVARLPYSTMYVFHTLEALAIDLRRVVTELDPKPKTKPEPHPSDIF